MSKRDAYAHQKLKDCPAPDCASSNVRLVVRIEPGKASGLLQCRCCGYTLTKEGTDAMCIAVDLFSNWNNQLRRNAAA